MTYNQILRIKEVDQTAEEAISSYGSFVKMLETTEKRVLGQRKFLGNGWTDQRISLHQMQKAVPVIHEAIVDRFGYKALTDAIMAHPFK